MSNFKVVQDIGYGLIPKKIMRDRNLSLQAKAIYSYLASFAGNTGKAFPSVSLMLGELGISKDTFYKYRNELENAGAITVEKERSSGQFMRNVYLLNNTINPPCPKSSDTVKSDTVKSDTVKSDTVFKDTISNSLKSNSLKSNNTKKGDGDISKIMNTYQSNFGLATPRIGEMLISLSDDYPADWILEAMDIAIENNARNIGYIKGVLSRWETDGKGTLKGKKGNDPYAGLEVF